MTCWLDDLIRDVPLGFRGLARDRLFAISVTGILGVGIATSVAMVSVLNAVVLRPLPYARPGELATINTHLISQNRWDGTSMANSSGKNFRATSAHPAGNDRRP